MCAMLQSWAQSWARAWVVWTWQSGHGCARGVVPDMVGDQSHWKAIVLVLALALAFALVVVGAGAKTDGKLSEWGEKGMMKERKKMEEKCKTRIGTREGKKCPEKG